jgi:hypothetical protein
LAALGDREMGGLGRWGDWGDWNFILDLI